MLAKSSQPRTIKYFLSSPPSGDLEWKVKGSVCCDLSPPERVSLTLFFTLPLYLSPQNAHTNSSVFLIHFILGGASSYINGCTTVFHILFLFLRLYERTTQSLYSWTILSCCCGTPLSFRCFPRDSPVPQSDKLQTPPWLLFFTASVGR